MAQATRITSSGARRTASRGSVRGNPAREAGALRSRLRDGQPDEQFESYMGWITEQPEGNSPDNRQSDNSQLDNSQLDNRQLHELLPETIAAITEATAELADTADEPLTSEPREDVALVKATTKLIDDLGVMKRTRFNAQARFEAKHTASVSAFTLAAIIEIALSLFGSNFAASMTADVATFINYASQVTAAFILGFGLVATLKDYQTSALYMQRCAMDWNNLRRELQIARPVARDVLQDFRRRYHEIEGRCRPNHSHVDYERAQLDRSDAGAIRRNRLSYFIDVYLVYACSGIVFIAFWITLWQFMVS